MTIAIIGGGPAGLMAAEVAAARGAQVHLYDAMASVGRKFLLAGKGGLNVTHAEPMEPFLSRYGARRPQLTPIIESFGPEAVRQWARDLGVETFVGTSGRVFPLDLKSAPLLRAWLRRLRLAGVEFHVRHRWTGWDEQGHLRFSSPHGTRAVSYDAVILALGGASWPNLGSDAAWVPVLSARNVPVAPLVPANCGFDVKWTDHFRTKFAGHPVKSVGVVVKTADDEVIRRRGEFVITETGLEGGVIYAVSAHLRDVLQAKGTATLRLDLSPDRDVKRLIKDLAQPKGKRTMATHLERRVGLTGVKAGLLRECVSKEEFNDPVRVAAAIKSLPVRLVSARPVAEAISTGGGVAFKALDSRLMLRNVPGVFCTGEMLDWEAPTGGYLLTACLATGYTAGAGAVAWLTEQARSGMK
ncbi:MAG: TIGR03862 family flavoprotein [Nitrospiraceae bacterium]|nr:TIGR03862 family flavoprotein [Nitrospiraceae bacterium]